MACVRNRRPAELRRGCAEKRITSWRKMEAQTDATRRRIPTCATTAVPGELLGWLDWRHEEGVWNAYPG